MSFLRKLRPSEKLVIVSSFTSSLDLIESLSARAGWGSALRLDGQVVKSVQVNISYLIYTVFLFMI